MKKAKKTEAEFTPAPISDKPVNLGALLSTKAPFQRFAIVLVGNTPLITHAWSEKAKREMLQKQVKATKSGKEARDPEADFVSSLYEMGKDRKGKQTYGFPVTGVKNAILSAAHKDKGIARSSVMSGLWLDADMVSTRPALQGAICDMPLVRVYGSEPQMREDMVKIGSGLNKVASLAYRAQFTHWALKITGQFNPAVITQEALAFLISESGLSAGLGEWRNEKKGIFGSFHLANLAEQTAWEKFIDGKGSMPVPANYRIAAE
jgi:hypothetical protein